MDKNALEFLDLLACRFNTAKLAGNEYLSLSVDGVMHRELLRILKVEGWYGFEDVPKEPTK